jgi:hypothetical protein
MRIVCVSCGFRLLLSDLAVSASVVEAYSNGAESFTISCPECAGSHLYMQSDLKVFGSHGRHFPAQTTAPKCAQLNDNGIIEGEPRAPEGRCRVRMQESS